MSAFRVFAQPDRGGLMRACEVRVTTLLLRMFSRMLEVVMCKCV
jgi:hypothetical protein